MEQIELEAVAFLILLEDVAAQAPGWSNDGTQLDLKGELQMPAPHEPDSLRLHPSPEISALSRMRRLHEATRPMSESAAQREHTLPPAPEDQLGGTGSRIEAAQGPIDKFSPHPARDASLLDDSWPHTRDDYRSRSTLEADDHTANASAQRRETKSETVLQDAETNPRGTEGRSLCAMASPEPHVPESDLTSLETMLVAGDGGLPVAVGEGLKRVPPTVRVWPAHNSEPKAKKTGSDDALKHSEPDLADLSPGASVAAPIPTEESTYASSRTTQRRAATQRNQNRELARRIAWLEDQLELKPDTGRFQNDELHPRLCYPV